MRLKVIIVLKRGLAFALSYGILFSYPSWALVGRLAYANEKETSSPGRSIVPKAEPGPSGSGKNEAASKDKNSHSGKDKDDKGKEKGNVALPPTNDCSEDNFAETAWTRPYIDAGRMCKSSRGDVVDDSCWKQFFILLAAANANAYYAKNRPVDTTKNTAVNTAVENSLLAMSEFNQTLMAKRLEMNGKANLAATIDKMSRSEYVKDENHKQCCLQLVSKARSVGEFIKNSKGSGPYNLKAKDQPRFDKMIAEQEASCSAGPHIIVAPLPPPPPPPAVVEKKENNKALWIILGIAAAAAIFLIIKNNNDHKGKKHHKKKRPTENPPSCKNCSSSSGGSTGGSSSSSSSISSSSSSSSSTSSSSSSSYSSSSASGDITGNTYPTTTGDDPGRDNTTGGVTGNTYTTGDGPGRDDTTGDSGTVTGSTTASESSSSAGGNVTGDTYPGDDGPGRTTDGRDRTLTPRKRR